MPLAFDAGGRRAMVWTAWCDTAWYDEVFADVIGVLATGSAFIAGLTAELAGSRDEIRRWGVGPVHPGRFPTPMLQVALCNDLLPRLEVPAPTAWREAYGRVVGSAADYLGDVEQIVRVLLDRRWAAVGGERLVELLPWDEQHELDAREVARATLRRTTPPVPFDVRLWGRRGRARLPHRAGRLPRPSTSTERSPRTSSSSAPSLSAPRCGPTRAPNCVRPTGGPAPRSPACSISSAPRWREDDRYR